MHSFSVSIVTLFDLFLVLARQSRFRNAVKLPSHPTDHADFVR